MVYQGILLGVIIKSAGEPFANRPLQQTAQLFLLRLVGGDQRLAAALLDRLTFHAHVLQFSGSSFRLRHSLTHQEEDRRHQ